VSSAAASDGASCCVCWLRAGARCTGASALVACVGLTATSSMMNPALEITELHRVACPSRGLHGQELDSNSYGDRNVRALPWKS
jgi:hypothetical protein